MFLVVKLYYLKKDTHLLQLFFIFNFEALHTIDFADILKYQFLFNICGQ